MFNNFDYTKRIFILDGHIRDDFIGKNCSVYRITNLLFNYLKNEEGYEIIIFINSTGGVSFLDEKSAQTMLPTQLTKKKVRASGLMKRNNRLTNRPNIASVSGNQTFRYKYEGFSKSITELREFIIKRMNNAETKTAIIFEDDKFLDRYNVSDEAYNIFRNDIINYQSLPVSNENIIFFLFSNIKNNFQNLSTHFQNRGLSEILTVTSDNKIEGFAEYKYISLPNEDEIAKLVNSIRLKNSLTTNFKYLDEFIANLAVLSKDKSLTLKTLHKELLRLNEINKNSLNKICQRYNYHVVNETGEDKLKKMIGINKLKAEIKTIIKGSEKNIVNQKQKGELSYRFKDRVVNKKIKDNMLHFALLGNPGTGKTTIAKIIGQIFRENGILQIGHTVKVTSDDLIAGYVGQSAIKTKEQIDKAMGGILFIDEAYAIAKDKIFGPEVIATLIEAMSDRAGELTIIFAGYTNDMQKLFNANKGFDRRVRKIELEDYTEDELNDIFKLKLKNNGIKYAQEILDKSQNLTANVLKNRKKYGGEDFGNVGVVENILNDAIRKAKAVNSTLKMEHFKKEEQGYFNKVINKNSIMEEFEALVGLNSVKNKIENVKNLIKLKKSRNEDVILGHFLFKGNPGTGKTTVANYITEQFYKLGAINSNRIIVRTANDFIARGNKHPEQITKEILDDSLNAVLFIDEAHQLAFNTRALKTIVPFMEDNRDKFTLIMAGYSEDIDKMLKEDKGLESRFANILPFPDYNPEELYEIFIRILKSKKYKMVNDITKEEMVQKMATLKKTKSGDSFGNARAVRNYFDNCESQLANRIVQDKGKNNIFKREDLEMTIQR